MAIHLFLTLFLVSLILMAALDRLWIGVVAKNLYQQRLAHLLGPVNWTAVIIFYSVFTVGLTFFAIYPTVTRGILASGLILGALYGLFTYATYTLSNQANLKDWPVSVTMVYLVWGSFLGAAVTATTCVLYAKFF